MKVEWPETLGEVAIDIEDLEAELKDRFPDVEAISVRTVRGVHRALYLHGDLSADPNDVLDALIAVLGD